MSTVKHFFSNCMVFFFFFSKLEILHMLFDRAKWKPERILLWIEIYSTSQSFLVVDIIASVAGWQKGMCASITSHRSTWGWCKPVVGSCVVLGWVGVRVAPRAWKSYLPLVGWVVMGLSVLCRSLHCILLVSYDILMTLLFMSVFFLLKMEEMCCFFNCIYCTQYCL